MEELKALESMGLALPSAWYIAGAILFGIVGYVFYRRGKSTRQTGLLWTGVALMLYPYAVSETRLPWALAFAGGRIRSGTKLYVSHDSCMHACILSYN